MENGKEQQKKRRKLDRMILEELQKIRGKNFNFNNLFFDKGCGHKLTHTK